jgi:hypothetical protein
VTTIACRQRAMAFTKLALLATATVAATIGLAGTATADDEFDFRSPTGDVLCAMAVGHDLDDQAHYGRGSVACQVKHTYALPPLADCALAGREYDLDEGAPSALGCQGGVIVDPPPPTLGYGHTRSVGAITCDVEPSGVTCSDSSTGHFMFLSRDSYELG